MKTLLIAAAVLALASCSQTKQLEEMHDSTKEMNETTKHMDTTMGNLNGQMGSMTQKTTNLDTKMGTLSDITTGLCRGSSQALPLQARQMTLNQLDRAVKGLDKISWAVTYVEGFDFQVWPLCQTTESQVDHMIDDAVNEFLQVVQRYDTGRMPSPFVESADTDPQGDAIDNDNAKDLNFNVLATAISYVNRHQLDAHDKDPKAPVYSFLSIIKESLEEGVKVKAGEKTFAELKQYQKDLLASKTLAVKILQARQQMAVAIVVGAASKVALGGFANKWSLARDRYFASTPKPWKFSEDTWEDADVDRNTKFAKDAAETRRFLKSIGVAPVINRNLSLLLKGMQPVMTTSLVKSLTPDSKAARKTFARAVNDLRGTL